MKELTEEVLGRLMAYDVEWQIGAGRYERNEERTTQPNGYRRRAFDTQLGTLDGIRFHNATPSSQRRPTDLLDKALRA